jgi:hypothetical protein
VRAQAHLTLASLTFELSEFEAANRHARDSVAAFAEAGDERMRLWATFFVATSAMGLELNADALASAEVIRDGFRAIDDDFGLAYSLWIGSLSDEDDGRAAAMAAEAEALFRELGSDVGLAHALESSALRALDDRGPRTATQLSETVELFSRAGNLGCTAHALETVSAWLCERDDLELAATLVGAAEELRARSGHGHRPWERKGAIVTAAALATGPDDGISSARQAGGRLGLYEATVVAQSALAPAIAAS